MKGEKLNLLLGLLLLPSLLMAQKSPLEPWQDPEVNEVNRMAAHTDFVNKNEWRMSLHGVWGEMPIPGMWEMNGLGEPMYCGIGYEWKTWWKSNPPALPDSANYSYTYVRNWTVPKAWKGRDVILHIGSVTSCVEVWCNGKYVGYGEDSKLEQEFDLTRFVRFGKENDIKMLVRRWCDGSYMEDQDFFRYKGFARETYLAARTKRRIEDVKVEALLNDDFSEGKVKLDVKTKGKVKWEAFNDDKPIMAGDTIAMQKGIRDPYIFRAPDGAFCVAMTDLHVFGQRDGVRTTEWERDGKKYDWGNNRGLVLLRSFNLIHWTRTNLDLTALTCPTGEVDAEGNPLPWSEMGCAWAPEMITTEDGRIMMHFTPLGYFDDGQSPMRRTNFSEQKHGAVVQVTKKELNKLIKYWNK